MQFSIQIYLFCINFKAHENNTKAIYNLQNHAQCGNNCNVDYMQKASVMQCSTKIHLFLIIKLVELQ